MSHDPTWTARFRFRIAKRLRSDEKSLALSIGEHAGTLYAEGETLKDSQWLYVTLPGFKTEQSALAAAARLKVALMIATIERGNGIDPGEDKSTGGFTRYFIENFVPPEIEYLNNVHGVQVYRYDGRQHFVSINANLTVTESPEMLLSSLASVHAEGLQLSEDVTSALETLSLSRLADHPPSQRPLCVSPLSNCLPGARTGPPTREGF